MDRALVALFVLADAHTQNRFKNNVQKIIICKPTRMRSQKIKLTTAVQKCFSQEQRHHESVMISNRNSLVIDESESKIMYRSRVNVHTIFIFIGI